MKKWKTTNIHSSMEKMPLTGPGCEEAGPTCYVPSLSLLSYFFKQLVILPILWFKKLRFVHMKGLKVL